MGMKRRRRHDDDPLRISMDEVVCLLADWKDACGGRFTIETSVVEGVDFALLRVRNIDEVRTKDLLGVMSVAVHAVSCSIDFTEQLIVFRFETTQKRQRGETSIVTADTPSSVTTVDNVEKELLLIQRRLPEEDVDDLRLVAWYVVAVKEMVSMLQRATIRFDISTSPGILTLTVKNLTRLDAVLLRKIHDGNVENETVIFLSPPESQCVRIRVKKAKRTVNL
jgi:hypothetical protein